MSCIGRLESVLSITPHVYRVGRLYGAGLALVGDLGTMVPNRLGGVGRLYVLIAAPQARSFGISPMGDKISAVFAASRRFTRSLMPTVVPSPCPSGAGGQPGSANGELAPGA